MNAFDQYEVWFVTGAQLLYGGVRLLDSFHDFQRQSIHPLSG